MGPSHIQAGVAIIGAVIVGLAHRFVQTWMRGIDVGSRKCVVVLAVKLPQFSGHVESVVLSDVLIQFNDVGLVVADSRRQTDVVVIEGIRRSRRGALVRRRVPPYDGLSHGADLVGRNHIWGADENRIALRAGACARAIAVLIAADRRTSARIGVGVGVVGCAGGL